MTHDANVRFRPIAVVAGINEAIVKGGNHTNLHAA